ncbi:MAG: 4'-phosphopantetheinyl transferase superfamily protein [Bacteroidales bacterium]|nr:4'-phosphopantetheinyl transferase superfamily protein [Bacteroidales bacterium]MDD4293380.1 4'-phosphopantetheinyl transferase superfamily protein [Bacteroidales bacterium]HPS95164.1 4'-phosphopantetheinyl transferase superfamily protein [Bacteroidales bacterium]
MGLLYSRELDNGATISMWEIVESEEELLNLCSIPNDEIEELQLTKSVARRREKLAVRALLNELFDGKVYLGHHDNGRPFLQNSLIEISISHTNRYVCVLTHPEESVGVDIESLNRDFSAVEKKALSVEEIENLSEKSRNLHLAIHWSAKEAIYKRMSLSDVDFSKQIEIKRFTPRESGEIDAVFITRDGQEMEFEVNYETFDNHILAWLVG